jgi:hypothetical protein
MDDNGRVISGDVGAMYILPQVDAALKTWTNSIDKNCEN